MITAPCRFSKSILLVFQLAFSLSAGSLSVAVAANFHPVITVIADTFLSETGHHVIISSASTGNLLSQILNGGPYDLFFAADTMSIYSLEKKNKIIPIGTRNPME